VETAKETEVSFSFTAIGTAADIQAQLPKVSAYDNVVGELVRTALIQAFEQEAADPSPVNAGARQDYEYRYTVNASGHSGGGSPLSLNVSVTSAWVPRTE
jgi:hypothetical protein